MSDNEFTCMTCQRPASYDPKKGYVACSGCGKNYFDECTCQPNEEGINPNG